MRWSHSDRMRSGAISRPVRHLGRSVHLPRGKCARLGGAPRLDVTDPNPPSPVTSSRNWSGRASPGSRSCTAKLACTEEVENKEGPSDVRFELIP